MCHACVIDHVKETMLSRRKLFTGAAATGLALGAAGMAPRAALAQASATAGRVVDLTHVFDETFPTFDGTPGIAFEEDKNIQADGYQIWKLTIWEHSGTHIDAPLHFSADGKSVAELEPQNLVCPLCIVDITAKAAEDANATVDPEDIEAWVSANGEIPQGALVAMQSGWAAKLGTPEFRNTADGALAFPGFSKAATDVLGGMGVVGIGVDTLSLDPSNSPDFGVHTSWLPAGHYGIECLAGLDQLPATGATIVVGAPKHARGTGGPGRILALAP
ncbi:cyclase family protein [Paracoccus sp. S-4012]|uniref:cyclase family protein n=1 Tax=Paracoccus sp. S-4012 TaxID=2665648 RepID=UPI0012B001A4|nr:cyclase family protein [Paracoccus sp. S-4012]MRX50793.1 cyclase family protein [Paracoccus sp. S-4012]